MTRSLKLTDAILGNANSLERLRAERAHHKEQRLHHAQQEHRLDEEIAARIKLDAAMEGLQQLMAADETIQWLVPEQDLRL